MPRLWFPVQRPAWLRNEFDKLLAPFLAEVPEPCDRPKNLKKLLATACVTGYNAVRDRLHTQNNRQLIFVQPCFLRFRELASLEGDRVGKLVDDSKPDPAKGDIQAALGTVAA